MVLSDKIRNRKDPEKMQYFLEKLVDMDPTTRQAKELLGEIAKLANGTPIDQFLTKFNLSGSINNESTPPSVMINMPGRSEPFVIDINDPSKKDFVNPQPVEKPPVSSFLTPEDLKALNSYE